MGEGDDELFAGLGCSVVEQFEYDPVTLRSEAEDIFKEDIMAGAPSRRLIVDRNVEEHARTNHRERRMNSTGGMRKRLETRTRATP